MPGKTARLMLLLALVTFTGRAETLTFTCISGNPAGTREPACSLGEAQLAVDVIGAGATNAGGNPYESFGFDQGAVTPLSNQVLFRFYLDPGVPLANIHEVYFDGPGPLLGITGFYSVGQVLYTNKPVRPPNLPGAHNVTPAFYATEGMWADTVKSSRNGVNQADESLGLLFNLLAGKSVADVLEAFDDGSLRIGIHAGGFPHNQSASFVNRSPETPENPIPEPGVFSLVAAGIGLLALRRRF